MSQLFIKTYAEYFNVIIDSKITSYCDNKAYVERLKQFIDDPYMSRGLFKQTEQEAYRIILQIQNLQFQLLFDDVKTIAELDVPAKLNTEADIAATTKARTPINTHLLSAPFAIYIKRRHIPH